MDVPEWLRQLENEAHRVRRTHATIAVLAGDMFRLPQRTLSREAVEQQFEGGEAPLG